MSGLMSDALSYFANQLSGFSTNTFKLTKIIILIIYYLIRLILFIGLIYVWVKGDLTWVKTYRSKRPHEEA